jgi:GT2 family glycosyltransferase
MHDLCVIIVSHNSKRWLDPALASVFELAGPLELDVVVVDNGTDRAAEYVNARFPQVRTIRCPNHGFGHANNRALETADARYVLFLNPDTEVLAGRMSELVSALDHRPHVGLAGVRQVGLNSALSPTIRRFPSLAHNFADALGVGGVPLARRFLGLRELDPRRYDHETPCDWTSGSFMLVRREALDTVGWFDERFFLFCEETDLCWRLRHAGWEIHYFPSLTIQHHEKDTGGDAWLEAQLAYAQLQFARKHFSRTRQALYRLTLGCRYAFRSALYSTLRRRDRNRRRAVRKALSAVLYEQPPSADGRLLNRCHDDVKSQKEKEQIRDPYEEHEVEERAGG